MTIRSLLATAALVAASQAATAQTFVGGIPAGWNCQGLCGTLGPNGDVTIAPTGAARYGYVVTDNETPSGLSPFALGGENTGGRLRSGSFAANAGDALKFYFNYVTSDGAEFTDYAWARLLDASDLTPVALLFTARTQEEGSVVPGTGLPPPQATLSPASVPIISKGGDLPLPDDGPIWAPLDNDSGRCFDLGCGYTGWVESTYRITNAGSYVLEFGVVNWDDQDFQSGLAFDGITVAGVPIVPEPHTWALFGAGLAALGWMARRQRRA